MELAILVIGKQYSNSDKFPETLEAIMYVIRLNFNVNSNKFNLDQILVYCGFSN